MKEDKIMENDVMASSIYGYYLFGFLFKIVSISVIIFFFVLSRLGIRKLKKINPAYYREKVSEIRTCFWVASILMILIGIFLPKLVFSGVDLDQNLHNNELKNYVYIDGKNIEWKKDTLVYFVKDGKIVSKVLIDDEE